MSNTRLTVSNSFSLIAVPNALEITRLIDRADIVFEAQISRQDMVSCFQGTLAGGIDQDDFEYLACCFLGM